MSGIFAIYMPHYQEDDKYIGKLQTQETQNIIHCNKL